ncbi:MAG: diaminopimelate decarboxylase [Candidatus Marinimicrobia bacterium]|nr:diaminopimelate decarboxylase [Candidatus Neomarinimicrobiota bacterium]MCF7840404.1 diaminopimelate decarboxylase [Candidatus Neomarinimicrobiota bacterium]
MTSFTFQANTLTCSGIPLDDIGRQCGTPAFIYSEESLQRNISVLKSAFGERGIHVSYAMKANSNLAILGMMRAAGFGVDIVSGGELYLVDAAGFTGKDISFAGMGKTREEMVAALKAEVAQFNVESAFELEMLNQAAEKLGKKPDVLLRLNPDIDAQTHPKITTGLRENKFGMPAEEVFKHFLSREKYPHLNFVGIHCHIGSQILKPLPFIDLVDYLVKYTARLEAAGARITKVDLGGGFGVDYETPFRDILETTPFLGEIADYAAEKLGHYQLYIQPGRVLVANTAVLLTRVIGLKHNDLKTFVVVDGAMTDMLRPSLYGAYHALIPTTRDSGKMTVDVVGPVCETGDYFAHNREISTVEQNDFIALGSAGAYGYVMASTYNARPLAPEILIQSEGSIKIIRQRQTYADFLALNS